jgi:hypothetical protein
MPVHDWTRVDAGLFHHFHQHWITALCAELNAGRLPEDYFALAEQRIAGPIPDVLALKLAADSEPDSGGPVGLAVATAPPPARHTQRSDATVYANKADRVTVRHRHGEIVAVVEIVSPGNKSSQAEFKSLVDKSVDLIRQRVHLMVIDLFPPGRRDPKGMHHAIWDPFCEEVEFEVPPDKPLVLASYDAHELSAYVESLGVGDLLVDMPIFLLSGRYVPAPLEATYQAAWSVFPAPLKKLLEP